MRTMPFVLSAFAVVAVGCAVFVGCGSDSTGDAQPDGGEDGSTTNDGSSTTDGGGDDGSSNDGSSEGGPSCKAAGESCNADTDCCGTGGVRNCEDIGSGKKCQGPAQSCKPGGAACAAGPECCTNACIGGQCSTKQCTADNQACTTNEECCGGSCADDGTGAMKCKPLSTTCKTSGNPCGGNTECCSGLCSNGLCSASGLSFCTQQGDVCATNADCCGGNCVIVGGALLGTCGATVSAPGTTNCSVKGTVCAKVGDTVPSCGSGCCSRVCAPTGAGPGFMICQPPSGCAPTGEICRNDSDCCGWSGAPPPLKGPVTCAKSSPTQEFGRCDNGTACREAGSICKPSTSSCSAENNCCDPNGAPSNYCNGNPDNCCRKDALGIPRCLLNKNDCATDPPQPGASCATSADCCGKPCVNNVCQATCVNATGTCTSHADCCNGLSCNIPTGSSVGTCGGTGGGTPDAGGNPTCALYGQTCTTGTDCCDGVPCTSGTCRYP